MEFPIKYDTFKSGWFIVIISKSIIFLSPKIGCVLANSADPDEMPHYAAFHLGLPCLPKYLFWGYWSSRAKSIFKREIAIIFLSTKLRPDFL